LKRLSFRAAKISEEPDFKAGQNIWSLAVGKRMVQMSKKLAACPRQLAGRSGRIIAGMPRFQENIDRTIFNKKRRRIASPSF